jgi:hypothetical protein
LLWKKAIEDLQVNAPFQKLRKNLLLFLQLLILAALLTAMARPVFEGAAFEGKRLIIVIDHTASMNATDVSPSRLENAKEQALELVDQLEGSSAMVMSFARQARVVQPFTSDVFRLQNAIESIEPTDETGQLTTAAQLINRFNPKAGEGTDEEPASVVLFSDGRVEDLPSVFLDGVDVSFIPIGADGGPRASGPTNIGFSAIQARRDQLNPSAVQVFAELVNSGPEPISVNVTLSIDGEPAQVTSVEVPRAEPGQPPGRKPVPFELTMSGSALLSVSHDVQDPFSADDSAAVYLGQPTSLAVLVVTPGNRFLLRAVRSANVSRLTEIEPEAYEALEPADLVRGAGDADRADGFDVIVFDRHSPSEVPPVNGLYFAGVPPREGLRWVEWEEGRGGPARQAVLNWDRDHPLLRYASLEEIELFRPGRVVVPTMGRVLATGQSGPLIAEVSYGGRRDVVVGFNTLQSQWPVLVSYPVFISNALQYLGPVGNAGEGVSFQPGQGIRLPVRQGGVASLAYRGPERIEAEVRQGRAVLPTIRRVGVYRPADAAARAVGPVAVNLADELESDLRPLTNASASGSAETVSGAQSRSEQAVRHEAWRWFAWVALAVLLLEWLLYTRKLHV